MSTNATLRLNHHISKGFILYTVSAFLSCLFQVFFLCLLLPFIFYVYLVFSVIFFRSYFFLSVSTPSYFCLFCTFYDTVRTKNIRQITNSRSINTKVISCTVHVSPFIDQMSLESADWM